MKVVTRFAGFLICASLQTGLFAASSTQSLTVDKDLKIPGAVLKHGEYTLSIEDKLRDRAIIRLAKADSKQSYLLLAAPNSGLAASGSGLVYFDSAKATKILRGWACADCTAPLELVYPKAEAAKIVGETGQSALAVDPISDQLPAHLSGDDMKVVTLWLLSPTRLQPGEKGAKLTAVKYIANAAPQEERASTPAPAPARQLPGTAGNLYFVALCGFLSLALAFSSKVVSVVRSRGCIR